MSFFLVGFIEGVLFVFTWCFFGPFLANFLFPSFRSRLFFPFLSLYSITYFIPLHACLPVLLWVSRGVPFCSFRWVGWVSEEAFFLSDWFSSYGFLEGSLCFLTGAAICFGGVSIVVFWFSFCCFVLLPDVVWTFGKSYHSFCLVFRKGFCAGVLVWETLRLFVVLFLCCCFCLLLLCFAVAFFYFISFLGLLRRRFSCPFGWLERLFWKPLGKSLWSLRGRRSSVGTLFLHDLFGFIVLVLVVGWMWFCVFVVWRVCICSLFVAAQPFVGLDNLLDWVASNWYC